MNNNKVMLLISNTVFVVLSLVLGLVCVLLPPYVLPNDLKIENYHFFELVGQGIEHAAVYLTAIMFFLFWCLLGYVKPQIWWLLGLSAMAAFPMIALVEMHYFPSSHNIWPIEFALYGIAEIPAFLGAFVGSRIERRRT